MHTWHACSAPHEAHLLAHSCAHRWTCARGHPGPSALRGVTGRQVGLGVRAQGTGRRVSRLAPPLQPRLTRAHSAAPRSCIIDKDELKDGLRVLIPMDDKLLYAGHVQTVHSPDM